MNKRILLVTGEGGPSQTVARSCASALESLGFCSRSVIYRSTRPFAKEFLFLQVARFHPDIFFVIRGDKITPPILRSLKKDTGVLLVNWWTDDPSMLPYSTKLSPYYDYFFTVDRESVSVHQKFHCPRVFTLTFGCDPFLHREVSLSEEEKSYYGSDIALVGSVSSQRADLLRPIADCDLKIWCRRQFSNFDGEKIIYRTVPRSDPLYPRFTDRPVWDEEMVKVYNASKIVVNTHSQGVVATTMRPFEAMGCGALLISEYRSDLNRFFKIGDELICFKEPEELRPLVLYYLNHEQERLTIARRGQQAVYHRHTYRHRMKELLDCIENGLTQASVPPVAVS